VSDSVEPVLRVLVLDDDADVAAAAAIALRGSNRRVETLLDPAALPARLAANPLDVLVVDLNYRRGRTDGREGLALIEEMRRLDAAVGVVVITAFGGVSTAVEAMKRGADDFVAKPWSNARLVATVESAAALARKRRADGGAEAGRARSSNGELPFVAASPSLQGLLSTMQRLGPTELTILLLGETGVGKNRLAEALHAASSRRRRPLTAFGPGLGLEDLAGGALFVEELADLSLAAQAELVALLDRREALAFRAVAASNRPREELSRAVRPDLRSRLSGMELTIPPLRERPEDAVALLEAAVRHFETRYGATPKPLSDQALAAARIAPWPGNARSVLQAAERAVALHHGEAYQPEDFQIEAASMAAAPPPAAALHTPAPLADVEREAVRRALSEAGFNVAQAAKLLGISRAALYRRMEKHGL